jgi:hypothetical protein
MGAKRLEVPREIIPDLARVACCGPIVPMLPSRLRETDRAAHAPGIAIVRIEVNAV